MLAEEDGRLNQAHGFEVTENYAESAVQLDDGACMDSGCGSVYIPPADFISVSVCVVGDFSLL